METKKVSTRVGTGVRLIAILVCLLMVVNSLLSTFGDTLTTYLGLSGNGSEGAMSEADCMAEGREIDAEIESEGAVLLRNENNTLPLAKGTKVTILGAMSYNYVCGGTGSAGGKYDEYTYTMKEAFDGSKEQGSGVSTEEYLDVSEKAWNWLESACGGARNSDTTEEYYGTTGTGEQKSFSGSDYAENKDAYGNGDWGGYSRVNEFAKEVYERDRDDILEDGDKTIVLINSSTPIELGPIESEEYGVDACLWIGHPGEAGLVGVAKVLTGDVNPSGHLVDTYAYDMSTMPSFYNNDDNKYTNVADIETGYGQSNDFGCYQYEEGIYVGYRFYETADAKGYFDSDAFTQHEWKNGKAKGYDEVVQYLFGYGLSHTTFSQKVKDSSVTLDPHTENSITVTVTNTGSVAGKQVVQLYMEAPYDTDDTCGIRGVGLQKAAKVLIGFEKTKLLQPGESEDVTITFDTDDLASFDTYGHGCYVLEKGDYLFHVGENAHTDACDPVKAGLADSVIYDGDGAGARDTDTNVAKVSMSDVDAGDGNMLPGYLSRFDFASGMETIMQHESSCKDESLSDDLVKVLATKAGETTS